MMLPDKDVMCHRTDFKKSCLKCVTDHHCRLWKRVQIDADRASGQPNVEIYDCIDSLMDVYMKNMLGRQDTTSASVDNLRKEVREANDAGMANALTGINAQIRRVADAHELGQIAASPQKLIGAN